MPIFGTSSKVELSSSDPELQILFYEVIKEFDCKVVKGHREQQEQDKAFEEGRSKLKYPNGNHNAIPSNAVDVYPYPIDMKNTNRFYWFAGFVVGIASRLYSEGKMTKKVRWGGDWDGDKDINDQTFNDLVHFELLP